jgi:hypothetical protein
LDSAPSHGRWRYGSNGRQPVWRLSEGLEELSIRVGFSSVARQAAIWF